MKDACIKRIERFALVLFGVALLGGLLHGDARVLLGVAAGGGIAAANFFTLRWLLEKIVQSEDPRRQGMLAVLLTLKFGFLAASIYLVIKFLPVDTLALLAGISVIVLAILVEGIRGLTSGVAAPSE